MSQTRKPAVTNTQNKATHPRYGCSPHLPRTEEEEDKTMDVTFVLEESGVTATVEVPCDGNAAAAKELACTALAVSTASVEMRIGTQVLEGKCRLQDTALGEGVQVVLVRRFADIKCPAEYSVEVPTGTQEINATSHLSLSCCGALCLFTQKASYVTGLDTDTLKRAFTFKVDIVVCGAPAISRSKTRCYLACKDGMLEVALPGGEVLRKVDEASYAVFACGGVVVSRGQGSVSVYDEDLALLRSLPHEGCAGLAVSDCGGWVITSSHGEQNNSARLWDVNAGNPVACVSAEGWSVALSRPASVFAVVCSNEVKLYDWSGTALGNFKKAGYFFVSSMQFTLCGKYLVVELVDDFSEDYSLHQYDVTTMSSVRVLLPQVQPFSFAISPCSCVVVFVNQRLGTIVTRHLYPY